MQINPSYVESVKEIRSAFKTDPLLPSVQLGHFFATVEAISFLKKAFVGLKKKTHPLQFSYSTGSGILLSRNAVDFISLVVGKKLKGIQVTPYSFTWRDYTIINDDVTMKAGYDVIIDVTDAWDDSWGGTVVYADGEGQYVRMPFSSGSLTIVKRKKGVQRFIKYVNHFGKGKKRRLLIGSF